MVSGFRGAFAIALAAMGCGGAPPPPTDVLLSKAPEGGPGASATATPPPALPGPSAVELVRQLGGAHLWATVEVAAFRNHPLTARLEPVLPFAGSLSKAGIDTLHEIDRILLSDRSLTRHRNATAIYEHHIDSARIDAFLTLAVAESDPRGKRTQIADHACALLFRHGLIGTACVVSPTLMLIAVEPNPALLDALARSSGIPHAPPGEAMHATFLSASDTLELGSFRPPAGLGTVEVAMKLSPAGGLSIAAIAPSDDPTRDTATLQTMLTTQGAGLRVGPIPLPPPPIHIEAIGQNVVASLPVSQDDLDIAMALIELTVPL